MARLLLVTIALFAVLQLDAQGFAWGIKGGMTVGIQNWNGFERDPLVKYHGILYIESLTADDAPFALFAQGGYHMKGSALRNRNFYNPVNGQFFRPPAFEFIFHNVAIVLGGKQKFAVSGDTKGYYMFGIRGDYTVDTNLEQFDPINFGYFPTESGDFVRKINYGVTLGGGVEVPFSDLIGALVELSVSPDFSYQYTQPEIQNVIDPYTGNSRTLGERRIRNIVFEITVGFRFLRKIEYIDAAF